MIPSIVSDIKNAASRIGRAVKAMVGIAAEGDLRVSLVYPDRTELLFEKRNLVVRAGKLRLLRSLYQGDGGTPIATLRVGNGGTIDPNGQFPKSVTVAQNTLFNELQTVPVTYTVDEDYPMVTYIADIGPDLCNNVLISEAGLFFGNGDMFNIKTFPGIPKTLDFSIHFEWSIRIN